MPSPAAIVTVLAAFVVSVNVTLSSLHAGWLHHDCVGGPFGRTALAGVGEIDGGGRADCERWRSGR
jgi:hypothetical protein